MDSHSMSCISIPERHVVRVGADTEEDGANAEPTADGLCAPLGCGITVREKWSGVGCWGRSVGEDKRRWLANEYKEGISVNIALLIIGLTARHVIKYTT